MDKYGLIGKTLKHSFSKIYFNDKFNNELIDAEYINFEISEIKEVLDLIDINKELKGLNVTIPYKEEIIQLLDEITPEAKEIGAVNVVRIKRNGNKIRLEGTNCDAEAFKKSIEPMILNHKKALILGTGGAAKAVNYTLKNFGLNTLFVGRTKKKGAITYEEITKEIIEEYKIIVNCTPIGMYPNVEEYPNLPYEYMGNNTLLYDLLYNPNETAFLKKGKQQGATIKNGLEMLLLQAFDSWNFWNK